MDTKIQTGGESLPRVIFPKQHTKLGISSCVTQITSYMMLSRAVGSYNGRVHDITRTAIPEILPLRHIITLLTIHGNGSAEQFRPIVHISPHVKPLSAVIAPIQVQKHVLDCLDGTAMIITSV